MNRGATFWQILLLHGCAMGACYEWEVDRSYPGTAIHGMVLCKNLIRGYDKGDDELIYKEVRRILTESGGRYSRCIVVNGSLMRSTRNNQIFLKIDCSRQEEEKEDGEKREINDINGVRLD